MEAEEVYQLLTQYNEDELFYRKLFVSRKNPEEYDRLVESLNRDWVNKKQLIIPELQGNGNAAFHFKDDFLDSNVHKNVYLQKHNRYTPPYEHDHEFFEIVYVLSGQCENTIQGNTDVLKQGDLCLLSPAVRHSIWSEDGLVVNILMRRHTIQNFFSNIFKGNGIISDFFTNSLYLHDFATALIFHTNRDEAIRQQILVMFGEQLEADDYSESIISNMLQIFFGKLARNYGNTAEYPQTVKKQNKSVSQIVGMMNRNPADITLSDVAEKLGYSVVYCSRYIKKITGCTYSELLKQIRLQKAEDLLKNTTLSISEIGIACGYDNPANFNRMFRQKHGMSPSAYRENHL